MSAVGDRIAIVSLGMSCQSNRQIEAHIPLLRALTGDQTLSKASLPFDWLISTVHGLGELIRSGELFPKTHEDLVADQYRLRHKRHDILYWHESRLLACAGHPGFEVAKGKFELTSRRFSRIASLERVIAVLSDTQCNLPSVEQQWRLRLTDTSLEEVDHLRRKFSDFLGRNVDLLMVSRNPRPHITDRPEFSYYHMIPESEGWAGNSAHWAKVFTDYFSGR